MFFSEKPKRRHIVDSYGKLLSRPTSTVDRHVKPKRKTYKTIILLFIVVFLVVAVWLGGGVFSALGKIVTNNEEGSAPFLSFLGDIKPNQIKGEGDGRINILAIGIGGAGHPGGQLADTVIVMSINPQDKTLALLSIPRDLYVPIPGYGSDKINSAHSTGVKYSKETGGGAVLLKKTVTDVLDLPIHYYVRMDFSGFIKLVDAVGGISVDIDKALSDPYYPDEDMVGYEPFYIDTGTHNMDGETALKYARSRETTSDFDRSRRQQQILLAFKDKALSLEILANPKKINDIIKILGDHLRTDMQVWEMQRIFDLLKDLDTSNIISKVLDNSPTGPLTSSTDLGGYYLVPKAGVGDFSEIQRIAHELFTDPYLKEENAKIEVLNGTKTSGLAARVAKMLESYGYNVVKTADNDEIISKTIVYDKTSGQKPFTTQFLTNRFSADLENQPKSNNTNIDITLVIGENYFKDE